MGERRPSGYRSASDVKGDVADDESAEAEEDIHADLARLEDPAEDAVTEILRLAHRQGDMTGHHH